MNDDNVLKFDENILPGLSSGTDKLQYQARIKHIHLVDIEQM